MTDTLITEPTALVITQPTTGAVHWVSVVHSDDELIADLRTAAGDLGVSTDRHPDDLYLDDATALQAQLSRAGHLTSLGVRKDAHR